MIPVLQPAALGQEITSCAVMGACIGVVRAIFPAKGRAAFVPDLLWVGAVLAAVQSYAAGESSAGVLRWYMAAAAFAGTGAAAFAAGIPLRTAEHLVWQGFCAPVRFARIAVLQPAARRHAERRQARKVRRSAKRTAKKHKKNLPNRRRMLYNSNVSK